MSRAATDWAWKQDLKPSQKLVLLSMADRAGEEHQCWPAVSRLARDTGLNDKTIRTSLKLLIESGIIADTGLRKGRTKQVIIFELVGLKSSEKGQFIDTRKQPSLEGKVPKKGYLKSTQKQPPLEVKVPKSGYLKGTQKQPPLGGKVPKSGYLKGTQKQPPLEGKVPKSGYLKGTQNRVTEPVSNNQKKKTSKKFDPKKIILPDWLSYSSWCEWIDHLKTKNKKITEIQAPKIIKKLARYRSEGNDPNLAIEHSIANGYLGVYPDEKQKNTTGQRNNQFDTPADRAFEASRKLLG